MGRTSVGKEMSGRTDERITMIPWKHSAHAED